MLCVGDGEDFFCVCWLRGTCGVRSVKHFPASCFEMDLQIRFAIVNNGRNGWLEVIMY